MSEHPSVEACTPHFQSVTDLNDDLVQCSVCGQQFVREAAPDRWGPFTVMANDNQESKGT